MNRHNINSINTALLLLVPGSLLISLGYLVAEWIGAIACAAAYTILLVAAWRYGENVLLRKHRAVRLASEQSPGLRALVELLSIRAGVPAPALYLLAEPAPQLMLTAVSTRRASLALSKGLLAKLSTEELAAVVAHALDYLRSGESRPLTIAALIAHGVISLSNLFRWSHLPLLRDIRVDNNDGIPSDAFLWILLAPVAAAPIRLVAPPSRQFRADDASTRLIGDPEPLCSALSKIRIQMSRSQLPIIWPATAHLFVCSQPFRQGWAALFRTHPSLEERIRRLKTLYCRSTFSSQSWSFETAPETAVLSNTKETI